MAVSVAERSVTRGRDREMRREMEKKDGDKGTRGRRYLHRHRAERQGRHTAVMG